MFNIYGTIFKGAPASFSRGMRGTWERDFQGDIPVSVRNTGVYG